MKSSVVIGLCSDPIASNDEKSEFIKAGADSFWVQVQKDPKKGLKEILEKWLVRNVRLNQSDPNFNQIIAELITVLDNHGG